VVLAGNRAKNIDDVERLETVFKDGVGYDPAKLMCSVEGLMGLRGRKAVGLRTNSDNSLCFLSAIGS